MAATASSATTSVTALAVRRIRLGILPAFDRLDIPLCVERGPGRSPACLSGGGQRRWSLLSTFIH